MGDAAKVDHVEQEVKLLQTRFDAHVESVESYMVEQREVWDTMTAVQKSNADSIEKLVESNRSLSESARQQHESTKDLVEIYRAAQGAVKVGGWMGRFLKWVTTLGILGAGFAWTLDQLGIKIVS